MVRKGGRTLPYSRNIKFSFEKCWIDMSSRWYYLAYTSSFPLVVDLWARLGSARQSALGRVAVKAVHFVHGREDLVDVGLEHHATHDDLVQRVVHLVTVEDQIEFADVLEDLVKRLDEDLNEIEDAEVTFLLVDREHEVERCVVTVDELDAVAPIAHSSLEEITERVWSLGDLCVDIADHGLLLGIRHMLVELDDPRLAVVVDDENALDHRVRVLSCQCARNKCAWSDCLPVFRGENRSKDIQVTQFLAPIGYNSVTSSR